MCRAGVAATPETCPAATCRRSQQQSGARASATPQPCLACLAAAAVEPVEGQQSPKYLVLDGRQRLASLVAFIRGSKSIGQIAGPGTQHSPDWDE